MKRKRPLSRSFFATSLLLSTDGWICDPYDLPPGNASETDWNKILCVLRIVDDGLGRQYGCSKLGPYGWRVTRPLINTDPWSRLGKRIIRSYGPDYPFHYLHYLCLHCRKPGHSCMQRMSRFRLRERFCLYKLHSATADQYWSVVAPSETDNQVVRTWLSVWVPTLVSIEQS